MRYILIVSWRAWITDGKSLGNVEQNSGKLFNIVSSKFLLIHARNASILYLGHWCQRTKLKNKIISDSEKNVENFLCNGVKKGHRSRKGSIAFVSA